MLVSLSTFYENLRTIDNLYTKYINQTTETFNEILIEPYKSIFSTKNSNDLINLLNLQINFDNSKEKILFFFLFHILLGNLLEIFVKYGFRNIANYLIQEINALANDQNLIVMAVFICFNIIIGSVYILLAFPILAAAKNQVKNEKNYVL